MFALISRYFHDRNNIKLLFYNPFILKIQDERYHKPDCMAIQFNKKLLLKIITINMLYMCSIHNFM